MMNAYRGPALRLQLLWSLRVSHGVACWSAAFRLQCSHSSPSACRRPQTQLEHVALGESTPPPIHGRRGAGPSARVLVSSLPLCRVSCEMRDQAG
ncbi:hypothetical protein M011DRAFT_469645 [Sporormia fimetaria CBS 119925]|uniref:Secreted protein n=1 Tax=Sporormia fimetaria CBS 119925 TaxID=1340428 RepID=A0A6A6V7H3_9PLEO|nr:hypothetical protein M011DRAFT_469645 [Sporormia fimetaria CBS 119925]